MKPFQRALLMPLLLLVAGVLLWLVVGPNLKLVKDSFIGPRGFTLDGYRQFFFVPPRLGAVANIELVALRNSVMISLGSVLFSALIGVPLAFVIGGYEFPGRRLFASLAMVPVLLPPLVGVVAFYFLYAESGLLTRLVQQLFDLERTPWRFDGIPAVLMVHAYSMYVYFYAFVSAGLQRLDTAQVEASATLGAARTRRFVTVTLPLLTPSLIGAALLVFMMSMASFTAPLMFNVRVLTIQLLQSRTNENTLLMCAETVVLTSTCLLFLAGLRWFEGRGRYLGGSKGAGGERRVVRSGWLRWLLPGGGVVAVLILLLPHAMLVLMSVADTGRWTTQLFPPAYTLDAYRYLWENPAGRQPFLNSGTMSLQATLANLLWAVPAAYLFARFRFRGRGLLEAAAMLPYAIPGTVIALGLAEWFSVHQWYAGRSVWVSTYAILPLAYFVRNLPLTLRAVQASLAQVDPTLEEAAGTLGSSPAAVLAKVVLPLVKPGAIAGGLLAMIAAMGEFVASWVLYIPANRPLAIEVWSQIRYAHFARAAAYGVALVALVTVLLLVAQSTGRREASQALV